MLLSCPVAKSKGRTPKPGEHPLSPSFETTKDEVKAGITQATKDCKGTKERVSEWLQCYSLSLFLALTTLPAQALIRDNRECLTTGTLDHTADRGSVTDVKIHTQCAHIIPQGMFFGVDPKSKDNSKVHSNMRLLYRATHIHVPSSTIQLPNWPFSSGSSITLTSSMGSMSIP